METGLWYAKIPRRLKQIFNSLMSNSKMKISTNYIHVDTKQAPEFIDITDKVSGFVTGAGINNGVAIIYSMHTTCAIRINENEPLLLEDMGDFLSRMAPREADYRHNDFSIRTVNMTDDECPNGHAHCQNLLLGNSENIPIIDGELQFGKWQSIFFVELDMPRSREVIVQIVGE